MTRHLRRGTLAILLATALDHHHGRARSILHLALDSLEALEAASAAAGYVAELALVNVQATPNRPYPMSNRRRVQSVVWDNAANLLGTMLLQQSLVRKANPLYGDESFANGCGLHGPLSGPKSRGHGCAPRGWAKSRHHGCDLSGQVGASLGDIGW